MRLDGKCEIQLFDKEGRMVDSYSSKNMFTNAIPNLLNVPMGLFKDIDTTTSILSEWINPLVSGGLGGVLLFEDALEENVDNVIAPLSQIGLTGHAGGEYAEENLKRGTFNASESEAVTNGYKFVWDFSTNQANGTISSVCLTSVPGGDFGIGDTSRFLATNELIGSPFRLYTNQIYGGHLSSSELEILEVGDKIYAAKGPNNGTTVPGGAVDIYQYDNKTEEIGVTDTLIRTTLTNASNTLVAQKSLINDSDVTLQTARRWYCAGDGKAHSLHCASTDVFHYAIIDLENAEILETKVIEANGLNHNSRSGFPFFLKDDYIYMILYTSSASPAYRVCKVSISSGETKILEVESQRADISPASSYGSGFNFDNKLYGFSSGAEYLSMIIDPEDRGIMSVHGTTTNATSAKPGVFSNNTPIPYLWRRPISNTSPIYQPSILKSYLATINNISPITKSPSQTMKIIYTVTKISS
ncbi:hypothetical protein IW492_02625 [Enterococcus sp. BWB1-3]|uniref:hypothetical protein n=1 Tax=Enterococcus sp. BWB1-3 TaxID=2787713 RepID=UPI001921CA45|nr:hypothetical protein [Enterococcus sp. BWB1-3]MBL1228126.1 hypothetical protein [Enterococcus sp. BWB1-3]